jgi:hypothetical protein
MQEMKIVFEESSVISRRDLSRVEKDFQQLWGVLRSLSAL